MSRKIAVVDFETEAIEDAPNYPPRPVGVAIKLPGRQGRYYAWGHPTENNCTEAEAKKVLRQVYREHAVLCHNCAFDLEVAHVHLGLPIPHWENIHDSMFLLYLFDPNARSISLKPSVKRLMGIEPSDQSALREWVLDNVPEARAKPRSWGAHISKAPGKLVGRYAASDCEFAWLLYDLLEPQIQADGMGEAYEVERQMVSVVLRMEREGVRINRRALRKDTEGWQSEQEKLQQKIWKRLGQGEFNINSPQQLADALESAGKVDEDDWVLTEKGNRSTARDSLVEMVADKVLLKALVRHSILTHMLGNFCLPWLERMETHSTDRLYPRFHSTRADGERALGTRSGRFSSSNPSFQQLNREPEDDTLPFMRRYLLAEKGHVLLCRDYDQQELRILADIIGGELRQMYLENPQLDLHEVVRGLMAGGSELTRSAVKQLNFSIIYGGGAPRVSDVLGVDLDEARTLKRSHSTSIPGLKSKMTEIQNAARANEPVITQGGRLYYPVAGKEYVQLNRRIQGSAADHTKRAMLRVHAALRRVHSEARMLIQVHDEIVCSVPKGVWKEADAAFKRGMEFKYFSIPTPTSGKRGPNWGQLSSIP